jgi:hypothetical protein
MLYLQHDFYNMIFKIKRKLYIASRSAPPPPPQIVGAHVARWIRWTKIGYWRIDNLQGENNYKWYI